MAIPRRPRDSDAPGGDVPGDEQAPDIVSPTGEEMPEQRHDDVDGIDRDEGDDVPRERPVEPQRDTRTRTLH